MNKHDICVLILAVLNILGLVYTYLCYKWDDRNANVSWEWVSVGWCWLYIFVLLTAWNLT